MRVPSPNSDTRQLSQSINELATGGTNAASSFTLAVGATSTLVKDMLASPNCWILISPTSASAVAASAFVSAKGDGSFTVTHGSAAAGANFDYVVLHG